MPSSRAASAADRRRSTSSRCDAMADPMRAEKVTLKDGRKVVVRPARLRDAESLLRNAKTRHVGGIGIAIRDGWREVGLGRILMERILEWMRARGFKKAELSVFGSNGRARRLYESLGFESEGISRRHLLIRGSYEDEILMGLWLQG